MHVEQIRAALRRQPFEPFYLRLADGRGALVPHPDFIALSPRNVIVVNSDNYDVFWVEPLLIISLDFVNQGQPAGPANNGAAPPASA